MAPCSPRSSSTISNAAPPSVRSASGSALVRRRTSAICASRPTDAGLYTPRVRILPRLVSLILFLGVPVVLVGEVRLPTPESVLGFRPGADYKLATYDQSVDYFKKVAAASKYVKLVEAGTTSQGRPMIYALVSSPDNLGKIDRLREIARRLAHPQGLSDAEAKKLAHDGKAFV